MTDEQKPKKERVKAWRGFATMSFEKQREIASLGGKAAHAKGTAHEFSSEEAREAGRMGGLAAQAKRSAEEQREIASLGGKATQAKKQEAREGFEAQRTAPGSPGRRVRPSSSRLGNKS